MSRVFRASGDGIAVNLEPSDRRMLEMVADILADVASGTDDPAEARLAPIAHPDDANAQRVYQDLMGRELDAARIQDASSMRGSLDQMERRGVLSLEEAEAWIREIGRARLAVAARAGYVTPDRELPELHRIPDEESRPAVALVHYLGWLQGELADALLARGGGSGE